MKTRPIVIWLILSLVLAGFTACNRVGGDKEVASLQFEVRRGDLTIMVGGSGTIEVTNDMKLTFGISGRIAELLAKEGDEVSEGEVVARLETDALELALSQAKVAHAQAQLTVAQYEVAVTQAGAAAIQAEVNLKSAEIALEQTTKTATLSDIKIAQAEVDTASKDLRETLSILANYSQGTIGFEDYQKRVVQAQARLKTAQDKLDAMLSGFDTKEVAVKRQQVAAAEQSLNATRQSLELAKLTLELGRQSLELAGQSRDYSQKQLDKATLLVPFAGRIASLPVDVGDTVTATTTIAHLIEPDRVELKVQVDEIDIPGVSLGQRAIIKVDALPQIAFAGKVSYLSPLPSKEGGVTLFEVKIELAATNGTSLKGGMSASAAIITAERNNVLLVPNRALKQNSRGDTIVEVKTNGKTVERTVAVGISDGLQTEIVNGLKEGEVVVEKRAR